MSSSSKQSYHFQIDALPKKLHHLTRPSEKSPLSNQAKFVDLMVGGIDHQFIIGLIILEKPNDVVIIGRIDIWNMRGLGTKMMSFIMCLGEEVAITHIQDMTRKVKVNVPLCSKARVRWGHSEA